MKFLLAGGSGQVGAILTRAFRKDGHEVVILSRRAFKSPARVVAWDGKTVGGWKQELEGIDVVINLAGRSVNCRYTEENRQEIMQSRVESTVALSQAIDKCAKPPHIWLQSSTATLYSHRLDGANDEITGIIGGSEPNLPETWRFSIKVAKAWEKAVGDPSKFPRTRIVLLRSAVVMSPDSGGPFDILTDLVRVGLGGTVASGKQYVSWIHEADFVRAIYWLIEQDMLSGPVNLASPHPLPNAEFMKMIRRAWRMPIGLPANNWILEWGAKFMKTETELVLKSRRVVPTMLSRSGFTFQFPLWEAAAKDLRKRWRSV